MIQCLVATDVGAFCFFFFSFCIIHCFYVWLCKSGQRALSCFVSASADIWILTVIFPASVLYYFQEVLQSSGIFGTYLWLCAFQAHVNHDRRTNINVIGMHLYGFKQQNELTHETFTYFIPAIQNCIIKLEWRNKDNAHLLTKIIHKVEHFCNRSWICSVTVYYAKWCLNLIMLCVLFFL